MNKEARKFLQDDPEIKDMASLFTDNLTALDIYKAESYLERIIPKMVHEHDKHYTIFLMLRTYLEELERATIKSARHNAYYENTRLNC